LITPDHERIFSNIYRTGHWGSGDIPNSGSGSLPLAAAPYVEFISEFIRDHHISSVLDIGHGDWSMWESYKFDQVSYIGIDVFAEISESLTSKYGNIRRKFLNINAVREELPDAQICITKDVFQHLPNQDIRTILAKLDKFEYLIICNDFYKFKIPEAIPGLRRFLSLGERIERIKKKRNPVYLKLKRTNSNAVIGGHRPINLEKKIFIGDLRDFSLIKKIDFTGSLNKRANLVKRVYVFRNIASKSKSFLID
jgi:hypothetical protein